MGGQDAYCVLCAGPAYKSAGWDPTILSEHDTEWLGHCRFFGVHPAGADNRHFISRRGECNDLAFFPYSNPIEDGYQHGEKKYDKQGFEDPDPDDPLEDYYLSEETPTVFHESCWMLLARILGYSSHAQINKSAMGSALSRLSWDAHCHWCTGGLDYGPVEHEQFFPCEPGDEFIGCEPKLDVLVDMTLLPKGPLSEPSINLDAKVIRDPFSKLPFDVLFAIMPYLPAKSRLNLISASHCVHVKTRTDEFWRWMIKKDIAPWYPEIRARLPELCAPTFNVKRSYFYLEHAVHNIRGMPSFLGVANRTRIMNACLDLAVLYLEITGEASRNLSLLLESREERAMILRR